MGLIAPATKKDGISSYTGLVKMTFIFSSGSESYSWFITIGLRAAVFSPLPSAIFQYPLGLPASLFERILNGPDCSWRVGRWNEEKIEGLY